MVFLYHVHGIISPRPFGANITVSGAGDFFRARCIGLNAFEA